MRFQVRQFSPTRPAILVALFSMIWLPSSRAVESKAEPLADFGSLYLQPLPLAKWLAEDVITVASSPHDIGEIANIFDGNFATVLRSAKINPQQTTIQFEDRVSVAAVRVVTSDPQDRWKIEGIVWSKDGKTSSRAEIVPWENVEYQKGAVKEIIFPRNLSVSELTLTLERINGDDYVHLHEWELLTELKVSAGAPKN